MKRLMMGWALLALFGGIGTASAEPAKAGLWIGVDGTLDGFLIDETTGNVWMTGVCLKPLGTARREGTRWRAELSEMVSVGRGRTLLEQAFLLETAADAPAITVSNPARGGDQAISGVVRIDCGSGDHCQRAAASPAC